MVVLPLASTETAEEVVQRIRRAVTHYAWGCGQPELGVSIGQAAYPADGTDAKRLLGAADGRMYADKFARKKERSAVGGQPSAISHQPSAIGDDEAAVGDPPPAVGSAS